MSNYYYPTSNIKFCIGLAESDSFEIDLVEKLLKIRFQRQYWVIELFKKEEEWEVGRRSIFWAASGRIE